MAIISDVSTRLNHYLETAQHRSYFLIFATVVFVMVMVIFGILPAYSAFTLQGAENQKRQEAIDQLTTKLTTLKQLTQESQDKSDLIKYFNVIFPSEPSQELILNDLIGIANSSGVFLKDMNFKNNDELKREFGSMNISIPNNVRSLKLSLNVDGSQQTINSFINLLEGSSRVYNIKNYNIVRKPAQEIAQLLPDRYYTLLATVNVYYFVETLSNN